MDEIVKEFLTESSENLDRLDQELVSLESDPASNELLASIFRTIHTIKGSCGFLGFPRLEKVTHTGEGLLARLRDGELQLNEEIASALLAMVDAVRGMLAAIRESGQDGDQDFAELIDRLAALQESAAEPNAQSPPGSADAHPLENPTSESRKADAPRTALSPETVRVGVDVLDRLMNLVGELVLARNRLLQPRAGEENGGFQASTHRLNLITGELQDEVMKARMQPISSVWSKFPRTVRDLARACKKEVRLEMDGAEVELDRTILEAIRDPMVHLVRNAIDHGIETPEVRQQAGKTTAGKLTLRAFHEAGRVNLEISDDGGGLNRERIYRKAIERGLISAQQAENMPDPSIYQLIFRPGFSTAEKVTSVSGRGVGMDVVKTNVESIGGVVEVHSVPGQGTTFTIRIPLTLAIIPALLVRCGEERFAIPQASLIELVRVETGDASRIETIQGAAVYRLRGRLLPLISLSAELQLEKIGSACLRQGEGVSIVVVRADKHEFGVIVDEILDTQEIVVKSLDPQLKRIGVYAGATILGDGQVALILDVHGLSQRARLASTPESLAGVGDNTKSSSTENRCEAALIVQCPDHSPKAIPVSAICRLEEVPQTRIEMLGRQEVIQYDGEIMPLIRLGRHNAETAIRESPRAVSIVVCRALRRKVGLVVERFLDIAEGNLVPQLVTSHDGALRAIVVRDQVSEFLDVPQLLKEWLSPGEVSSAEGAGT